jgi:hypothetical protein
MTRINLPLAPYRAPLKADNSFLLTVKTVKKSKIKAIPLIGRGGL